MNHSNSGDMMKWMSTLGFKSHSKVHGIMTLLTYLSDYGNITDFAILPSQQYWSEILVLVPKRKSTAFPLEIFI